MAVPYLLNPAGIVTLVTLSAESDSFAVFAMVLGVLALVLALDVAVFRWANRVSDHLDESQMLVTEKIFGFLLAALAVQLMLDGLDSVASSTSPATEPDPTRHGARFAPAEIARRSSRPDSSASQQAGGTVVDPRWAAAHLGKEGDRRSLLQPSEVDPGAVELR